MKNAAFIILCLLSISLRDGVASFPIIQQNKEQSRSLHSFSQKVFASKSYQHPIRSRVALKDSATSLDDKSPSSGEEEELTVDKIAEIIEVSFIQACMQLAQGYVDVQKMLLAAIYSAYDADIPLNDLIKAVNECPMNTANRDLTSEEIDVRTTSMSLVYLTRSTLDRLEGKEQKFESLGISEKVGTMFANKVEEVVRKHLDIESPMNPNDEKIDDPMQAALMAHYEKTVISLTMTVVDETNACYGDGLKNSIPRPPIPGTN